MEDLCKHEKKVCGTRIKQDLHEIMTFVVSASVQGSTTQGASRDPGPLFMNAEVQRLLKKVTTLDHERVFKARLGRARVPAYNLMTAGQLAEVGTLPLFFFLSKMSVLLMLQSIFSCRCAELPVQPANDK